MIVVYTQDNTIIKSDAEAAKHDLISMYGERLGAGAYATVKNGRIGTAYRRYGGPLVRVVDNSEAEVIKKKEIAVGMI